LNSLQISDLKSLPIDDFLLAGCLPTSEVQVANAFKIGNQKSKIKNDKGPALNNAEPLKSGPTNFSEKTRRAV
jgi:hypothetical protein